MSDLRGILRMDQPEHIEILNERQADYGDAGHNHRRIAALFSAYLGTHISAHDVAILMILVKVSRAKAGRREDNYTDMAGYAEIARRLR
jgi:hypothetical protein